MNREIKFRAWYNGELFNFVEITSYKDGSLGINIARQGFSDLVTAPKETILEQFTGLKGYEGDIIDVCIFLVSPSNPDNDQHFRGVIEFENGCFVFVIHKYLNFDGNKSEWVNIKTNHLPFGVDELDEDGTFTVPYYDFLSMSGNLGEFCEDNIEIIGNIHENPELLS